MTKTRKPDTGVISLADEQAVRDAVVETMLVWQLLQVRHLQDARDRSAFSTHTGFA